MNRAKCKNGHVISELGRDKWGHCIACQREADAKRAPERNSKRRQMALAHRAGARSPSRGLTEDEELAVADRLIDSASALCRAMDKDQVLPSEPGFREALKSYREWRDREILDDSDYRVWLQSIYNLAESSPPAPELEELRAAFRRADSPTARDLNGILA